MAEEFIQRPAAVQAGINAFLEKNRGELRRIHTLEIDEQEQALSALMNLEINRIAKMGPQEPEKEVATSILVALETDRILGLNSDRQQKVIATKYGLDPGAIIAHYPELQAKGIELHKRLVVADKNESVVGWAGFLGTLAATLIPFWKPQAGETKRQGLGDKFSSGNSLIKWAFVSLASLAIGFGSSFIGSRLFATKIKQESKALVIESRTTLEREIGDAINSKVREAIAAGPNVPAALAPAAPAVGTAANIDRRIPPQPREGFAAEAAKEKVAAQGAGATVG